MLNKIHIWIGEVTYSEEDYWSYFDDSQSSILDEKGFERKKENIICSPFSIDVGLEYDYDPDFIGFYFNEKSQNLEEVLQQQPAIDSIDQIKRDCFQKGIKKANAMFYYTDENLKISNQEKLFNGMKYIGCYQWDYIFKNDNFNDDNEVTIENFWDDW